jgi:hypothetical protein
MRIDTSRVLIALDLCTARRYLAYRAYVARQLLRLKRQHGLAHRNSVVTPRSPLLRGQRHPSSLTAGGDEFHVFVQGKPGTADSLRVSRYFSHWTKKVLPFGLVWSCVRRTDRVIGGRTVKELRQWRKRRQVIRAALH